MTEIAIESMKPQRSALRFDSFQRAVRQLQRAVDIVPVLGDDSDLTLQEEGMIQRFEYCFELGWKLLKDLALETVEGGEMPVKMGGPRDAIRWGFGSGWVGDGEVWMDMLRSRNLTVHVYDRQEVQPTLQRIRGSYLQAFHELRIAVENAQTG